MLRINGRSRRVPPIGLLRALGAIRRGAPPVDASFRDWATLKVGDEAAERMPDGPTILAVPMRAATRLLGAAPAGAGEGTTTALLDLGLVRRRTDPYVVSDLDAPGFCETFTVADPSLAPAGQHLVQTQAGMRPDETLDAAVARLEALVDSAYTGWRARETWRRRARIIDETGALDLPGCTWRDRVWLVNDRVAAPGLLSEVTHHAALDAVEQLGAPGRSRVRPRPVVHRT
jgi:hypothetical protein